MKQGKLNNMDSLFKDKENTYYNRYNKKIYKGRIVKAIDKKYALEEYEKKFRFETEFPIGVNDNYNEFISFFEKHEKLGHSMSSAIQLLPKGREDVSAEFISIVEIAPNQLTEVDVQFIENNDKSERSISIDDEEFASEKSIWSKWNKRFERINPEELVAEYAHWKAKKRFLTFLQTELSKLQSSENVSEIEERETNNIRNAEHTTRRQTLAIHYLDLQFKINGTGQDAPLNRFIHFLTDKNMDNIKKAVRNPLKTFEKKKIKADAELLKDLEYIRVRFADLELTSILKLIDRDIAAISKDLK